MGIHVAALLLACVSQAETPPQPTLREALERGMKPGALLSAELIGLSDYPVRSREDAQAIVAALGTLKPEALPKGARTDSYEALVRLFLQVPDAKAPAFGILKAKGVPEIERFYDALKSEATPEEGADLVSALQVLAAYGAPDVEDRIVDAARRPALADSFRWRSVLSTYFESSVKAKASLFARFREDLPLGFAGILLLDDANEAAIGGRLKDHPFDTPKGVQRLADYLGGKDPERFSFAVSAARSLPFLKPAHRGGLLAFASQHPEPRVKLTAAWARVKTGDSDAVRILAAACLEIRQSALARDLLVDLGRERDIPKEVHEPDFEAKSEFSAWLSHPNELGRPPDRLDIVAAREFVWPTGDGKKKVYRLIRYTAMDPEGDDVGVGIVGTSAWCSFWDEYAYFHPDDLFGCYAAFSMGQKKLTPEVEKPADEDVRELIARWRGPRMEAVRLREVKRVTFPGSKESVLIAIAEARRNGQAGWAIIDQEWSAFYPTTAFPPDFFYSHVLDAHIGRRALGLPLDKDRVHWLKEAPPKKREVDPLTAIRKFEELFAKTKAEGTPSRGWGKFEYAVEEYALALKTLNRGNELKAILKDLEYIWRTAGWRDRLIGDAARLAGLDDVALPLLEKEFSESRQQGRGVEASDLARLLAKAGRKDDAEKVLFVALRASVQEGRNAKYMGDLWIFEKEYQGFRSTFVEILGEAGKERIGEEGFPESLLPAPFTLPER